MKFEDLNLAEPILKALAEEGYTAPTPIQQQAIQPVLDGYDVLGCAQTGTGKTAAFALPILQRMVSTPRPYNPKGRHRPIRALVLSPTRELAGQIGDSFTRYGRFSKCKHTVIFGGVSQNRQVNALRNGVDVLVATPGRLQDLMDQGLVDISMVELFVLDEADRMLDMGFIGSIRKISTTLPPQHQTLFFSATMSKEILALADTILNEPVRIETAPVSTPAEKVEQHVFFVDKNNKQALLEHVLTDVTADKVLVFSRTKHGADRIVRMLGKIKIHAEAIHANKSQNARQTALKLFKEGKARVLVATDIASRGIDVDDISHVINFDLPNEPETYVHRIGRTGRAGASGIALSFCAQDERPYLRDIERITRTRLKAQTEHPFSSSVAPAQGPVSNNPGQRPQGASRFRGQNSQQQRRPQQKSQSQRQAQPRPDWQKHHKYPKISRFFKGCLADSIIGRSGSLLRCRVAAKWKTRNNCSATTYLSTRLGLHPTGWGLQ